MSKRVNVTLYSVCFKGLYGRNRSVKFECSPDFEVTQEGADRAAGNNITQGENLQVAIREQRDQFAGKIRAKSGKLWIVRYDDCEVESGEGIESTLIPITQGVRICGLEVVEGQVRHAIAL